MAPTSVVGGSTMEYCDLFLRLHSGTVEPLPRPTKLSLSQFEKGQLSTTRRARDGLGDYSIRLLLWILIVVI